MKEILAIGGIALGAYGIYLLVQKKKDSCGCSGKKNVRSYVQGARHSKGGVRGNGQLRAPMQPIMSDSMREVFDASPAATCCPSVKFPNFMYPAGDMDLLTNVY